MRKSVFIFIVLLFSQSLLSQDCSQCETTWTDDYWGEQCCDVAFDQWGFDCAYMENEYGWDCTGCSCIYDENYVCGDGYCNGNETLENCSSDCTINGCNTSNQVDDCYDDDCCPVSWIGDGYADCEEPDNFGCDLSCYNNDGGDCLGEYSGDINDDGILNILDVILMVNMILNNEYSMVADINQDDMLNILDVIMMVNILLEDSQ